MTDPADFGRTYWRAPAAVEAVLPPLDAGGLDDGGFRLLADSLPTLCWIANGDGYIVWYNRRWYQYTGTTPEQMEGWGWTAVHDPALLPDVMERWRAAIDTAEPFEMTFPLRGSDGVFRPFLTRVVPVRDATGAVARWCGVNTKIADQVAAEQALRASEERLRASEARYRDIVEGAEDFAIVTMDDAGVVTSWNIGAERLLGWREDEAVGRPGAAIFTPEDRAQGLPDHEMNRATASDRAVDERWHVRKDGSRFWGSGLLMKLEGGGFLKMFRDRTAEHEGEASMRASEARLLALAKASSDVLYRMSPDWGQMHELTGGGFLADTSDPTRAWLMNYIPADERGRVTAAIEGAITSGTPFDLEHRVLRADGAVGWTRSRAVPMLDDAGAITEWFGAASDITARREAEMALRELNRTLEQRVAERTAERDRVWRLSRDLLGVADDQGVWLSVNPAWTRLLGWTEEELIGRTSEWLEHPDDQTRTRAEVAHLAAGHETLAFENRFRVKDGGYRWLSWTATPEAGLLYCIARDITADKEREAELERTQEQLRQAQKMEAVGQLTGGIAHDFNNLLTGVIGSLDMMQRRIARGETDRIERYATTAMTSANRAAALTHRLLAFSRRQPLDPKPVNANRLISGMEELLRRTIGESVRLEIVTAGGLWQTLCDPHQLESAIINLAINARDAMPDGGRLTVETCNAHLDNAYAARARDVTPGQYVCICVSDTGTGMSADVIAKAWEPFFTTKPIGQGTGLGLSMIYGFARQSEGYAKIYSEVGQGTTIKLYLPRYYGEAEEAEAHAGELTDAHRAEAGETVLVVEDETAVRDLVVDVLGELGYQAIEAVDGPSGLRLLQSETHLDLLITDVGLPGLNGRQLADAARALRPDLKVLFMTGYAENATVANGFLDPGMAMITKPFAIEALATRIRDMIEEG